MHTPGRLASLEYTPERHHGETLNPVSFGWVLALDTVCKLGLDLNETESDPYCVSLYPLDWPALSRRVRFERAGDMHTHHGADLIGVRGGNASARRGHTPQS
jgi:hypothetical protein